MTAQVLPAGFIAAPANALIAFVNYCKDSLHINSGTRINVNEIKSYPHLRDLLLYVYEWVNLSYTHFRISL